jgi:hypothetical protein
MRARQLKPGFFKNEDLAECSPWARLVFAGLWTMADRAGRLEDRPKRIKAELLPFDSEPILPILDELERWGFIRRYKAHGRDLMWIPRFAAHQNPHKNEKESELPPHPDDPWGQAGDQGPGGTARSNGNGGAGHDGAPDRHGAGTVQARCEFGKRRASSPIPSSPTTSSPTTSSPIVRGQVPVRSRSRAAALLSEPSGPGLGYAPGERSDAGGGGVVGVGERLGRETYEAQAYAVSLEIQQIGEGYPPERFDPGAADTALKEISKRRQWPGLGRVLGDLAARLASDQWTRENGRFAPMLSRYIRERMWLMKVPEQRAAPDRYASPESKAIDDIAEKLRRKEQPHDHTQCPEGDPAKRPGSAAAPGAPFSPVQAGERAGPVG